MTKQWQQRFTPQKRPTYTYFYSTSFRNWPDGVVGYHVSLTVPPKTVPIRSWDRAPVWSNFFGSCWSLFLLFALLSDNLLLVLSSRHPGLSCRCGSSRPTSEDETIRVYRRNHKGYIRLSLHVASGKEYIHTISYVQEQCREHDEWWGGH